MNTFHSIIRENLGSVPFEKIGLLLYVLLFLYLLKYHLKTKSRLFYAVPFVSMYFGMVFANIFGIFLNGADSYFLESNESIAILILKAFVFFWEGTKVLYGGYVGSVIGISLFCLIFNRKQSFSDLLGLSAVGISLLFAFWRISCFTGGCCYGIPSDRFGINFAKYSSAYVHLMNTKFILPDESATIPLIPTQLISSVANLTIFVVLLYLFLKKRPYPYFLFFAQAFLYGSFRFTIEFIRMDPREYWGPLSISQWIFVVMLPFIAFYFYKNGKKIIKSLR